MEIESIITIILFTIILSVQLFFILKSKSDNFWWLIKDIWEFRNSITESINTKFSDILKENRENEKTLRESVNKTIEVLNTAIKEKIDMVTESVDSMTIKVDTKLQNIQKNNNEQLEKMRHTVDEKLQNTLEKRLGESFRLVSERLELVHKWLGEMQSLAIGVWDLKKVLSNVKTRWTLWEIQLWNILEQILSPEQYDKNVKTKKDSNAIVEFAIKLPGKEEWKVVYIPLDAKFPLEKYHHLIDAYNIWDVNIIKEKVKELETAVLLSAKDIRDKYIDIPNTTEFGIMFFPIEWLYAEVVRSPWLLEKIQKEYKIMISWPTTLVAMLNSLQMWFRTLAIEKRSSEVWNILASVKKEFETFGVVLEKAQKKIREADQEIDNLVWTRTKQMNLKLRKIDWIQLLWEEVEKKPILDILDSSTITND